MRIQYPRENLPGSDLRPSSAWAVKIAHIWIGPFAMSLALVGVTTVLLRYLEVSLALDPLIFIYFVPTTYIALRYGSTAAMVATVMSGIAAAYFLYRPYFSFAVHDPMELMQIGFFILLAVLASQVVSGFVNDRSVERRRPRPRRHEFATMRARLATLVTRLRFEA